jgi:hypothetical protein
MMVVWPTHVVAGTSEEERRNCCVHGPLIAELICCGLPIAAQQRPLSCFFPVVAYNGCLCHHALYFFSHTTSICFGTIDRVQKRIKSECYTPLSETFRIQLNLVRWCSFLKQRYVSSPLLWICHYKSPGKQKGLELSEWRCIHGHSWKLVTKLVCKWTQKKTKCTLISRHQNSNQNHTIFVENLVDRLCGLFVRVPGYRSRGPGSIPGATRSKKCWVWNGVHSALWIQLSSYLKEIAAPPV